MKLTPTLQYKFFPSASKIANHGPGIKLDLLTDPSFKITDRDATLFYQAEWMNKSVAQVNVKSTYVLLQAPFDPTNSGGVPLPAGEEFNWKDVGASFTSDIRRPFNFLLAGRYGGYYNGTGWTVNGELNYRVQPYGSIGIVSSYNNIELPIPTAVQNSCLSDPDLISLSPTRYSSRVSSSTMTRSTTLTSTSASSGDLHLYLTCLLFIPKTHFHRIMI